MTAQENDLDHHIRDNHIRDNHLDIDVVLSDIRRHVSIDGREPSMVEAKALYRHWFIVVVDDQEAV